MPTAFQFRTKTQGYSFGLEKTHVQKNRKAAGIAPCRRLRFVLTYILLRIFKVRNNNSGYSYNCADSNQSTVQTAV